MAKIGFVTCFLSVLCVAAGCGGRAGGPRDSADLSGDPGSGEDYELEDVMALYADSFDKLLQTFSAEEATLVVGYKLAHMVEWPEHAFRGPQSPFIVGIGVDSPLLEVARKILVVRKFRQRPIEVRAYGDPKDAALCHMAFVGGGEASIVDAIVARQSEMLTISTDEAVAGRGLMLNVSVENKRLKIGADEAALKAADLVVEDRLFGLGR